CQERAPALARDAGCWYMRGVAQIPERRLRMEGAFMRASRSILAVAVAFLFLASPARAAVLLTGGSQGTQDPPKPTEGATTEEDWNPVVTCVVVTSGSIDELLDCLLDRIATPPPPCPPQSASGSSSGSGGTSTKLVLKKSPSGDCSDPDSREDFIV